MALVGWRPALSEGANNNPTRVKALQAALNARGFRDGLGGRLALDGEYGPLTAQAVRRAVLKLIGAGRITVWNKKVDYKLFRRILTLPRVAGGGTLLEKWQGWLWERVGRPYVWGASGPWAYDCSGLMMRAFEFVGRSIPRGSWQQHAVARRVTNPRPGDVFYLYWLGRVRHTGALVTDDDCIEAKGSRFGVVVTPRAVIEAKRTFIGWYRLHDFDQVAADG